MPAFDPTSTSSRWSCSLERFNTYLVAAHIIIPGRGRAEVYVIFKTLEKDDAKDCKSAVKAVTKYFEAEKKVIYQTHVFKQATQGKEVSLDELHTRLPGMAKL